MYRTPALSVGLSVLEALVFLEPVEHQMQALSKEVTCLECSSRDLDSWLHYDWGTDNLVWGVSYECRECGYEWRSM